MKISFLQAEYGDCIHIFHNGINVVIDSGPPDSNAFLQLINNLKSQNQRINLLVITHYDRDHIGGVTKMTSDDWSIVDNIWFNSANELKSTDNNDNNLSQKDAVTLQKILEEHKVHWDKNISNDKSFNFGDNWALKILYAGYDIVPEKGGDYLMTPKCDWPSSFSELVPYLNDRILDKSEPNASSIILMLTNGEKNVLLPGDGTPATLLKALSAYSEERPLLLDIFKLPHHGSYKNITETVLKRIICSDYVVLTNGENYFHPNKKMMLKILTWGKRNSEDATRFHLNYYQNLISKLNISEAEMAQYKLEFDGQSEFEL